MIQIGTGLFAVEEKHITEFVSPIGNARAVLFNSPHYIETMFFTDSIIAYPYLPSAAQMETVSQKGYAIYAVNDGSAETEMWRKNTPPQTQKTLTWIAPLKAENRRTFGEKLRTLQLKDLFQ